MNELELSVEQVYLSTPDTGRW